MDYEQRLNEKNRDYENLKRAFDEQSYDNENLRRIVAAKTEEISDLQN